MAILAVSSPPANLTPYDRAQGFPGIITPTFEGWGYSTVGFTAGQVRCGRVVPTRNMTITLAAFNVTTAAGSNDNIEIGVYDSNFGRLATSGLVAGKLNVAQVQTVPLSISLTAGTVYHVATLCPSFGSTGAQMSSATIANGNAAQIMGTGNSVLLVGTHGGQTGLPTTLAPSVGSQCHVVALRES